MKKFFIFVCSFLIFTIIATQVWDYLFFLKNIPSPINTEIAYSPVEEVEEDIVTVSISAVGDCFFGTDVNTLGAGNFEEVIKGVNYDYSYFFSNVKKYFDADDLTIINYEGSISSNGIRAEKEFAFRSKPDYIKILTEGSVEVANLSNNHSWDYGATALGDTKKILSENGISYIMGSDVAVMEKKGVKIGLIGTSTMRPSENNAFIQNLNYLKEQSPDIIIAVFHWGDEKSTTPNESQKNMAHLAIDNGADLVIGHHPHVLQGIEKYNDKYILYSLGNFSFGGTRNPSDKDTMIFNQVFSFKDGELLDNEDVSIIPCSMSSIKETNNYQPTPLSGDEFVRVKNKIIELSKDFGNIDQINFVEN